MEPGVIVAVTGVVGSVLTAALSYTFAKRRQLDDQWRKSKLTHYRRLLSAISDLAVDNQAHQAHRRFALAINTIALVAPQAVVEATLAFHDGVKGSGTGKTIEEHDRLLSRLMLAIRADLRIRPKDDAGTFKYHLAGAPPGRAPSNNALQRTKSGQATELRR